MFPVRKQNLSGLIHSAILPHIRLHPSKIRVRYGIVQRFVQGLGPVFGSFRYVKSESTGLISATGVDALYQDCTEVSTLEMDRSDIQPVVLNDAVHSTGYAVTFSSGIRKLKNVSRFLGVAGVVSASVARRRKLPVRSVVVWGRKQNARKALDYARSAGLPVQYVEDGWIRSCSENSHSRTCYSLLVDDIGVYYDSTSPSSLENFLNLPDTEFDALCGATDLEYATQCRRRIVENNISKYNFSRSPDLTTIESEALPLVLVLDQTMDDASVTYGGMDQNSFNAMLDRALNENPLARVVVRTHPDVVAGRRKGYLQARAMELGVEISANGDSPLPWLKKSSRVYAGTSQLGYEALLCGCEVFVAGLPFYAGWGLTRDFQKIERRIRSRTLDQLFYATHVHFARYCSPVSGEQWSLLDCIDHVCVQKRYFQMNARKHVCVGMTPWKKRYIAQFLRSPDGQVRFSRTNDADADETPVCWSYAFPDKGDSGEDGGTADEQPMAKRFMRVEDGFLRSKGLGSDFVAPASLVFDETGLYFDARRSSSLEQILNTYRCSEEELVRARNLRRDILEANLTKYNLGSSSVPDKGRQKNQEGGKRILVVGQVEGDQSILKGSRDIVSNAQLLLAVKASSKEACIVYKPHPDVESGNRQGTVDEATLEKCVERVETTRHFLDCLNECDELHTMTSLSGFEGILRGKKVVTYGMPFYAGWGLTEDRQVCDRRTARLTVDQLIYLCLAVYPRYADLESGEFVSVEQLIMKMKGRQNSEGRIRYRWVEKITNIYGAMVYRV